MSGILRLESLTKGNTLKQGDKTPLKYRLFDADGEKLNIAGKSARVRFVNPDISEFGYEKDGLTVAQDDTVTFAIDKAIPPKLYYVEIIVDEKFIFPSRADEAKFTIDKSSVGIESNIIEIVGLDSIVVRAVDSINSDPSLIIDEEKLLSNVIANTGLSSIDEYYQQFNDVITELSEEKDYHSLPEISGARGGFDTLGERLNNVASKLTNVATIDFVLDCGGVGDGVFNNYSAFIKLKKLIDSHGKKKVKVLFPGGDYAYKPLLPLTDIWRDLIQPVDFDQIFYIGQGARIIQIKDATWNANGTPSGKLEHESPIQFRRGKTVYIEGLEIIGDRVPYTGVDGSCSGIYLRDVDGFVVRDGKVTGWGTDGMTISRDYGNGAKCKNGLVQNMIFDNNTRQGVSVTGGDYITFFRCQFKNTNGGSFGHGLDLETNTGSQKNIKVIGCDFYNNQRGAMNTIGTTDVVVDGCYVEEPNCNGAFYFDGSALPSRNIKILNTTIITDKAVLYLGGTDVKDVLFENCDIATIGRANEGATIRLVPASTNQVDNIAFRRCQFKGIGGILSRITGKFIFEDCEMVMSNISNLTDYTMVFQVDGEGIFKNSIIKIDETVSFPTKTFKIAKGKFDGMDLQSHTNAVVRLADDRNDPTVEVEIGLNKFSEFFYYWGEVFALSVYEEKRIIEKTALGRVVHGGYSRTVHGKNSQVGDVMQMFTTDNKLRTYVCTVAGSPGTWVMTQGV